MVTIPDIPVENHEEEVKDTLPFKSSDEKIKNLIYAALAENPATLIELSEKLSVNELEKIAGINFTGVGKILREVGLDRMYRNLNRYQHAPTIIKALQTMFPEEGINTPYRWKK